MQPPTNNRSPNRTSRRPATAGASGSAALRGVRAAAVLLLVLLLSGCLSIDVTVDVTRQESVDVTFRYIINRETWDLGTFDDDASERAIPVSRRDAEESALLHDGLELLDWRLDETEAVATITTVYRAHSSEALAALWGGAGGGRAEWDPSRRRLVLPVVSGAEAAVTDDPAAAGLLDLVFAGQTVRIALDAPGALSVGSAPAEVEHQLGALLTRRDPLVLTWAWAD